MFCNECGHEMADDDRFCPVCGAPATPPETPAQPQAAPVQPTQVAPAAQVEPTQAAPAYQPQPDPASPAAGGVAGANVASPVQPVPRPDRSTPAKKGLVAVIVAAVSVAVIVVALVVFFNTPAPAPSADTAREAATDTKADGADDGDAQGSKVAEKGASKDDKDAKTEEPKEQPVDTKADPTAASGYLLPLVDTHTYTADELAPLSDYQLYLARNEIYARHGRGFKNVDLQTYFDGFDWYVKRYSPEAYDALPEQLNATELANVDTLNALEQQRNSPYRL